MAESIPAEALRAFARHVIGDGKRPRDGELAEEGDRLAGMVLDYLRRCIICGHVAPAQVMFPVGGSHLACNDRAACEQRRRQAQIRKGYEVTPRQENAGRPVCPDGGTCQSRLRQRPVLPGGLGQPAIRGVPW